MSSQSGSILYINTGEGIIVGNRAKKKKKQGGEPRRFATRRKEKE